MSAHKPLSFEPIFGIGRFSYRAWKHSLPSCHYNFPNHIVENHQTFDPENDVKFLDICTASYKLTYLGILEIHEASKGTSLNCMNDQVTLECQKLFNSYSFL